MKVKISPPKGVSSLSPGRVGRLRSRPPDPGEEIFKIYLLMREKEREIKFKEILSRSLERSSYKRELVDRQINALLRTELVMGLLDAPEGAGEQSVPGEGQGKRVRRDRGTGLKSRSGKFPKTSIGY